MMIAMMSPSCMPMLWRYRQAVHSTGEARLNWLTVLAGAAYFFVWTLFGLAVYPPGIALAAVEMRQPAPARAAPLMAGAVVLIASAIQFTSFKARHLGCCREAPGRGRGLPADAGTALRFGLGLGLHCGYCCAGFTAMLLAIGVMDLPAMALVTSAITAERLAPGGTRLPRGLSAPSSPGWGYF
jgi:predicted metal-binding membrane protein